MTGYEKEESMGRGSPDRRRWVFYYDRDCGLCVQVVRVLSWIDLSSRVKWTPCQALESPPDRLNWDDLALAAYLDTGSGRLYRGFYAFRKLTLRLVPLVPLAPILWCPGASLLGVRIYRWIASNRYRLSCCPVAGPQAGRQADESAGSLS